MLDIELFNKISDFMYILDIETHEIVFMNKSLLEALHLKSIDEIKHKKCYFVLRNEDKPCEFCTNHLLKKDKFYEWESYNQILERRFLNQDTLIEFNGRLCRLEISKYIDRQDEIENFYEKLGLEILGTALKDEDIEDGIEKSLGILGNKLCADRIYIFERNNQTNTSSNSYEWCSNGVSSEKENLQNIDNQIMEPWYQMFDSIGEVFIENIEDIKETFPIIYDYLKPQNISTLVALPYFIKNEIKGFFGADNIDNRLIKNTTILMKTMAMYIADLIEKRDNRAKLEKLSKFDSLTNLYNRSTAEGTINNDLLTNHGSLLIIDIDCFKSVNDLFGHQKGDELLNLIAEKIKTICEENDIAFRLGGDEFGIYFSSIIDEEIIKSRCTNLINELVIPVGNSENEVVISASIGVAIADKDGKTFDELYANADKKLYRAKELGKNRFILK